MEFAKKTQITVIAFVTAALRLGGPEVVKGQTCPVFTAPETLNSHAASDTATPNSDVDPQVATDGDGNWVTVWGSNITGGRDFDVLFSRSTSTEASWSEAAWVNNNAVSNTADWAPRLATDGNLTWVVVWWSQDHLDLGLDTDPDILFSRSEDSGVTWNDAAQLNSTADSDNTSFSIDLAPQLATDGNGVWMAVWDSDNDLGGSIGADTDILFSISTDNGASWDRPPEALNDFADSDNNSNWRDEGPAIATDGDGTWMAVWSSTFKPLGFSEDFEIAFSRSIDNGMSWSETARLTSATNFETNHDKYPQIATDGNQTWVVVWQSGVTEVADSDIMFSRTVDDGMEWSSPQVLISGAGSRKNGSPQIATDKQGHWFVVWDSSDPLDGIGLDRDILFLQSFDDGEHWTAPAALNGNAASPGGGNDFSPSIATDRLGNWTAVWQSQDTLDGTIGGDTDILVARLTDCNRNGIPDACDLADCDGSAWCSDCQAEGLPGFGILDECDILYGISDDCSSDPNKANDIPDECESDFDNDSVADSCDNCLTVENLDQRDCNNDGEGDLCDLDQGEQDADQSGGPDGVCDGADNCPDINNPGQEDTDDPSDGYGNACDNCPTVSNTDQRDCNGDGEGDACDLDEGEQDIDQFGGPDGVCDGMDNCPQDNNPGQEDTDLDGPDGVGDACDNCPALWNPLQENCDGVGVGDICAIADGLSPDCNENGIPDVCDLADCDGSKWCSDCQAEGEPGFGIPDECDIAIGLSNDCVPGFTNDIPDECEADCDDDGEVDTCTIARCTDEPDCSDCHNSGDPGYGVPDWCDINITMISLDLDDNGAGNGVPDECEFGAPLAARYPHDRRKNRYISFDPNKTANDGWAVAFRIELIDITLGSCVGISEKGAACRPDRGDNDCRTCRTSGDPCINVAIDCPPSPGQECNPTGETCINDTPDMGGSNVGMVWWVGPEKDTATDPNLNLHLLVSETFRKVSDNWPDPVHAGDCEVVPQASYSVRAVEAAGGTESDELEVQTTQFSPPPTGNAPFWWGDVVGILAFHCNADIREQTCDPDTSNGDCTGPATPAACCSGMGSGLCDCPGGDPCERAWELPNGVTNVDDVTAALWTSAPTPPTTVSADVTWVDVHGNGSFTPGSQNFDPPNNVINASDLQQIGSAFGGFPYKFYDPADCPDEPDWP